jgi:epsilon-lactone hydrolase
MGGYRSEAGGPVSWQARLLRAGVRLLVRPRLARERNPSRARAWFLLGARLLFRDPPFALYLPDRLQAEGQDLPVLWAQVAGVDASAVLLYLHGGAYIMGSPRTHRALAARLAQEAGIAALLPRYRLAPEHPFPAAFDDAVAAYAALLARGYRGRRIVLAGDSAGGGLALALLAEIGRRGWPAPAALVAFSPLADLSFSGRSMDENAARDTMLPAQRARDMREFYLQGADPADPRASPLFADWSAAPPPVLIQVAESEILLDDGLRMARCLRDAGGEARCDVWGHLPHVWPVFHGWLPEADAALRDAGAFLKAALRPD